MSDAIPQEVVEDAILVLDVYASQHFWSPRRHMTRPQVADLLDVGDAACALSSRAWLSTSSVDLFSDAAEAAQRLREGWRP